MNKYRIIRTNIATADRPQVVEHVDGTSYKDAVRRLKVAIRRTGGYATDYRYKEAPNG